MIDPQHIKQINDKSAKVEAFEPPVGIKEIRIEIDKYDPGTGDKVDPIKYRLSKIELTTRKEELEAELTAINALLKEYNKK